MSIYKVLVRFFLIISKYEQMNKQIWLIHLIQIYN